MDKVISILQVIVPILTCIFLGMYARKKQVITMEQNRGIQQFILKFCIPCVLFNSCLGARLGPEAVISMVLLIPMLLFSLLWAFRAGKKKWQYHNMPMLFAAHETGMLGIPLFIILFGADRAYHMGLLDMAQAFVAVPVISYLSADTEKSSGLGDMVKSVFSSPILIMGLMGFALGLSGGAEYLDSIGIGLVIRDTTSFMAQPVSAAMLFSIGYNFDIGGENRGRIFRLSAVYLAVSALICLVIQLALSLVPSADYHTRMAVLLYCLLPGSFLAPGLGKSEEEFSFVSGVCSVLTCITLVAFCIMSVMIV